VTTMYRPTRPYDYLPVPPEGLEVRTRGLKGIGDTHRQEMTCGGFFASARPSHKMTFQELAKVAALTIDVDVCDAPFATEFGATRAERKAKLYEMSEDDVVAWLLKVKFAPRVCAEAAATGLPALPNRVIYTGHGVCLVYWFNNDEGYPTSRWSPGRMKDVIKAWHAHKGDDLWWWDHSAKDIGTRIFPVPGGYHRATGKQVRLYASGPAPHDNVVSLDPWFDRIQAESGWEPAKPRESKAAIRRQLRLDRKADADAKRAAGAAASADRGSRTWSSALWPAPEMPEDRSPCPLCASNTSIRHTELHTQVVCFKCYTRFRFDFEKYGKMPDITVGTDNMPRRAVVIPEKDANGVCTYLTEPVMLEINDSGHAVFPEAIPDRVLLTTRTGTGKTHLMERIVTDAKRVRMRILAVSPFVSLAKNLAERLGLEHAAGGSGKKVENGDMSCSFAALKTVARGWKARGSVILVDEVEQMLTQVWSMLRSRDAVAAYNALVASCAYADKVILADAHASLGTRNLIKDILSARANLLDELPTPFVEWSSAKHKWLFAEVEPIFEGDEDDKPVQSANDRHIELIMRQVKAGKRVAVAVYERKLAQSIGMRIQSIFDDMGDGRRARVIVGSEGDEEPEDFSQASLTVDALIYNTAMSTGVSFDKRDWFDHRHVLVGKDYIGSASVVEQMLHRVRHPIEPHIFVSGVNLDPLWADSREAESWKLSPQAITQRYKADEQAASVALRLSNVTPACLLGEYHQDMNLQVLGCAQAASIAAGYHQGRSWTMACLRTCHTFLEGADLEALVGPQVEASGEAELVREQVREIHRKKAEEIATAELLDEQTMDRVGKHGPRSKEEATRALATRYASAFGPRYEGAAHDEKVEIASEALRGKLNRQVLVYAQQFLIRRQQHEAVGMFEVDRSRGETIYTYRAVLPQARLAANVLSEMRKNGLLTDARPIPPSMVPALLRAARQEQSEMGLSVRGMKDMSDFQQLSMILRTAGLRLRSKRQRGPDGDIHRTYTLDMDRFELVDGLSKRWQERILADHETRLHKALVTGRDVSEVIVHEGRRKQVA
jgi:hypothetical protein